MRKVRTGATYRFLPVGMDIYSPAHTGLERGTLVRVVKLHGCPPPNTMGHAHVETLAGEFAGLVLCNSLMPKNAKFTL